MRDYLVRWIAFLSLWAAGAFAVSGSSSDGGNLKQQDIHVHGSERRLLRQEEPLLVRGLWNWWENPHKDSKAARRRTGAPAGASAAAPLAQEKAVGSKQWVTFGANGALLKMRETPQDREDSGSTGGVAWRFIARDGRQIVPTGNFDGPAELGRRLAEVEERCPLVLGQGWTLIDSAVDTEEGHHWILQGPIEGKKSLLHVSSVIKGEQKGRSILRFSPRKSCGPSALLQLDNAVGNTSNTSDIEFNEPVVASITNANVVDSWLWAAEKLKSETAANCGVFQQIDNITLISARMEVAAGLNVFMTVSVTPVNDTVTPTYHTITCDWHVESTGDATMHPDLILPYRASDDTQLSWCELLTESTNGALVQLASIEGHEAIGNLHRRFGWLGVYRDFRPNPDLVELEDLAEIQEKARKHLETTCTADVTRMTDHNPEEVLANRACFVSEVVENQGECASCWAFSVATALAQRLCIKAKTAAEMGIGRAEGRRKLSKQQIMSCNPSKHGCNGGQITTALEEAMKGISFESDYQYNPSLHEWPWQRRGEKCNWGSVAHPFIVRNYVRLIRVGEQNIRKELYCHGAVVVGFYVLFSWISFYEGTNKGAVFTEADGPNCAATATMGHAVSLYAWGLQDGTNYWKLTNSWGPQWGDDGNFKMQRGVDLCGIENTMVLAGNVTETEGTWRYSDWSSCSDGQTQKTRTIECFNNDLVHTQDDRYCPRQALACEEVMPRIPWCHRRRQGGWPDKANFPDPDSGIQEEIEAISDCTQTEDTCTRHTFCNSNGNAAWVIGANELMVCQCTCDPFFVTDDCGQCADNADGYPHCREVCKSDEWCNDKGVASGNIWQNEFGARLHNCECDCHHGFMGNNCEQCVAADDTWPDCTPVPQLHSYSGGTWTTTTTWPPCEVWQGPIELEPPPAGSNPRAILRCDVRSADCSPDMARCVTGSYVNFCRWNGTFCVPKDANSALEQNLRLYLTGNSYALPLEASRDQSSKVIMWQNETLGLMPSELGLTLLSPHR